MGAFKEPHGGTLKELYLGEAAAEEEKQMLWFKAYIFTAKTKEEYRKEIK